ncbi:NAD-dependent epimerase/dehydratase family protein, partial [bacterium]|nr:NAD-dependent epimerase/dehydratase family protein [bacterium]
MGKILVTGGLGYIGSHTVVELVQSGHEVLIVDDLSNSKLEVKERINEILETEVDCEILDIRRTEMLASLVARHEVEAVIHFAAFKAVGESVEHPIRYYRNNITGLISVLEVMEDRGIDKLIFSSSCTVYGDTS